VVCHPKHFDQTPCQTPIAHVLVYLHVRSVLQSRVHRRVPSQAVPRPAHAELHIDMVVSACVSSFQVPDYAMAMGMTYLQFTGHMYRKEFPPFCAACQTILNQNITTLFVAPRLQDDCFVPSALPCGAERPPDASACIQVSFNASQLHVMVQLGTD
jgi:hypothetical protein